MIDSYQEPVEAIRAVLLHDIARGREQLCRDIGQFVSFSDFDLPFGTEEKALGVENYFHFIVAKGLCDDVAVQRDFLLHLVSEYRWGRGKRVEAVMPWSTGAYAEGVLPECEMEVDRVVAFRTFFETQKEVFNLALGKDGGLLSPRAERKFRCAEYCVKVIREHEPWLREMFQGESGGE